jgi:hypothetical protein
MDVGSEDRKVDGTGSGTCPLAGFDISGVTTLCSATSVIVAVSHIFMNIVHDF